MQQFDEDDEEGSVVDVTNMSSVSIIFQISNSLKF